MASEEVAEDIEGISHSVHSTLRENILEHVFIGDLLRTLWRWGVTNAEVLRSEFDAGGYDLVISRGEITRHVQLKSVLYEGKTASFKVATKLEDKQSGCVVCLVVTDKLEVVDLLYFGGSVGRRLPGIENLSIAKHTKCNAEGLKLERPLHRVVKRNRFESVGTIDRLIEKLLGISEGSTERTTNDISLDELLSRVTPENIHGETKTGPPVGLEVL